MTSDSLARSYLHKARVRRQLIATLAGAGEHSDVVRLAQECVELALKASLRHMGIDPPKWHDVGPVLQENASLVPASLRPGLPTLAALSKRLRKERELSFYGDTDFVPTEEYREEDSMLAMSEADTALAFATEIVEGAAGGGSDAVGATGSEE